AVVRHFMPVSQQRLTRARMTLDGKSWHEPGRANAVGLEQSKNPLRADKAELPARERRRARHAAGVEPKLRVEVEAQAAEVARPLALPERGHACKRHSIV